MESVRLKSIASFMETLLSAALCVFTSAVLLAYSAEAQETSLCANVRIEIVQELAFERQAFDARMRIGNALDSKTLDEVNITVAFTDDDGKIVSATSNPDDTSALFFIRVDSLRGIQDISGAGTVQPSSDAEIHWLIIPSRGAAGDSNSGKRYFIGATLTYRVGGELQELKVAPDFVTVKPQPQLELDYFLTREVRADDPFTQAIEPAEPFTLGVRVTNSGRGPAGNVTIDSAQPKIIDNDLGLLISFRIIESFVDEAPAKPTLLMGFGNILPGASRVGRWNMETTLSGRFTEFNARFTHADELGGRLTSLLSRTSGHLLVHDVLVDLPGRDGVRDFLAQDGPLLNVYESSGLNSQVNNQSAAAVLSLIGDGGGIQTYDLEGPPTAGLLFVKLPSVQRKEVLRVLRSDGKLLAEPNAWFSAEGAGNETKYYFNLFDALTTGRYRIEVTDAKLGPRAPVIQYIPDRTRTEGQRISFIVEASDPNGTIPAINLDAKPAGASFTDRHDGTAVFDWPTSPGQAGNYPLTFRATDGALASARSCAIRLNSFASSDGDSLPDEWEMRYFNTLSRDGSGDFDGDGVSDLDEYKAGTDPTRVNAAPGEPVLLLPLDGAEANELKPLVQVKNAEHGEQAPVYDFEVYTDEAMSVRVAHAEDVAEASETTSWRVDTALTENQKYFVRVRARIADAASLWVYGSFYVNSENEPPSAPVISYPRDGRPSGTLTPHLILENSSDPDRDRIVYDFELATDATGQNIVTAVTGVAQKSGGRTSWLVPVALTEDTNYYWRATARDEHGLEAKSAWTPFLASAVNGAPTSPLPTSPAGGVEVTTASVVLKANLSEDAEGAPLTYFFEVDTQQDFLSGSKIISGEMSGGASEVIFEVTGLQENAVYFWRVKASDGSAESPWAVASFKVNKVNDPPSVPTVKNPGMGAWVEELSPLLEVNPSIDPDGDSVSYLFEVYRDETLTQFVTRAQASTTAWRVDTALSNHETYYWRVSSEDEHALSSNGWSAVHGFFVNQDGINDAPVIELGVIPTEVKVGSELSLSWTDSDPDSNASIALKANGTAFAQGIAEDPDGTSDTFVWSLGSLPAGDYQICAESSDGLNTASSCRSLRVTDPNLPQDADGDGRLDVQDNCPYEPNPTQLDRGGLGTPKPDGIGNACQCGDVSADGKIMQNDVEAIKNALKKPAKGKLRAPQLCDVNGNGACDKSDAALIEKQLKSELKNLKKKAKRNIKLSATLTQRLQNCGPARP